MYIQYSFYVNNFWFVSNNITARCLNSLNKNNNNNRNNYVKNETNKFNDSRDQSR